jgi:DNA polymerase I
MKPNLRRFGEIWAADFEFTEPPGERPTPICLVAWELRSGKRSRLWGDELRRLPWPPYRTDRDVLFVAYYASAEMKCHLALGWPMPENVIDLYTEFRNRTNGIPTVAGAGLLGALIELGIDCMDATEKDDMRQLAIRGGPWTEAEKAALLEYCESDVAALPKLLEKFYEL